MIKLKSLIKESNSYKWIEVENLTDAQRSALYEYMVTSGGVKKDEYENYVKNFKYAAVKFPVNKIIDIINKWGWDWKNCDSHDEKRINKIKRLQQKTNQYWPYVVGIGHSLKQWAKDEMNHGDGWHRMCVSLRQGKPIEFLFLKIKKNTPTLIREIKSPYIVVGMVDFDLNVISSNNIGSHSNLLDKHPEWNNRQCYNWRFNIHNNTLYWYNDPTDDMIFVVTDEIKKKYPHHHVLKRSKISTTSAFKLAHGRNVLKQSRINSNDFDYQKKQTLAHGDYVDESYYDNISDDEKNDLANSYFSVGQDDDYTRCKNYCWIWNGDRIIAKKGGTHGVNFTHDVANRNFKGWYDTIQNKISIAFPSHELRKLGDKKPTVDDIPEQVYQSLIRKFGKRKPTFIVFENIERFQLKRLIREVVSLLFERQLRGEWWFEDGSAVFADGDVGDMNHEAHVIDLLRRGILDALGVDAGSYDYAPDFNDIKDEIIQSIGNDLNAEELEAWKNDEFAEVIVSYLKRNGDDKIDDKIYYIRGHDSKGKTLDVRDYALINWGWQRVKGNVIQTQTLTSKDLSNIVSGILDAYHEELEDKDEERISDTNPYGEHTFNIEVISTRSWYGDIPMSVLEKKDPMSLQPYRTRYE